MPSGLEAMKQEIKKREQRQERKASNENQVFIPNLYPKDGDTSLLFISDLDAPRDELEMVWFEHYNAWYLRNNEVPGEKFGRTFVYNSSDELHPEYVRELEDIQNGESSNNNAWKEPGKYQRGGMAYVFNLSAYKAIIMGKARTPVEMAYKEMWENTPKERQYPDNFKKPQLLWLKGGMIAGLQAFVNEKMKMGEDNPSLWDHKFTMSKTVENNSTRYSMTPDWEFELENLPDDIQELVTDLRENFSVPSLKEKMDSMRYKGEDDKAPFEVEASYNSDEEPPLTDKDAPVEEDNSDDDFEIPMPEFPEADEETKQGIVGAQKRAAEAKSNEGPSWLKDVPSSDFKIGDSVSDETKVEDSTASSTDNVEESSDNQSENTKSDEVEDEQEPSFDW